MGTWEGRHVPIVSYVSDGLTSPMKNAKVKMAPTCDLGAAVGAAYTGSSTNYLLNLMVRLGLGYS